MENRKTKKGEIAKSNAGRKQIYTDDVGVTLSVQVPSKQKEIFKKVLLEMRKPYEINQDVFMDISQIPKEILTDEFIEKLRKSGIKLVDKSIENELKSFKLPCLSGDKTYNYVVDNYLNKEITK